jgi:hypothetical protein
MTNGKSLAKTNQRTINALIAFLEWIVFFHSTSCNAFVLGVQAFQSPKTPSKTILITNNGRAVTTLSFFQLPNDSPVHFKQLSVPNDNSALNILQICVPMTTTSTGLQAYNDHHSSLNDVAAPQAFSKTTATMTATMTQVPAITTAIMKATLLKLDKCFLHPAKTSASNATIKRESLLLHA